MRGRLATSLTPEAVSYAWRQLLSRIGIGNSNATDTDLESLGLIFQYSIPTMIRNHQRAIFVVPSKANAWSELLLLEPNSVDWLPTERVMPPGSSLPLGDSIPVLFWGAGHQDGTRPFAELRDHNMVVFHADIIAAACFVLSRWEESVVPIRDQHGRFPAAASVAYRQGFLDRPILDEYALILGEWLRVLLPSWQPRSRPFAIKLSHDVDHLRRYPHPRNALRTVGGDLLRRRSLRRALVNGSEAIRDYIVPHRTQYMKGIEWLADQSQEHGLGNDAFYFMAAKPGPPDGDYHLTSRVVRRRIDALRAEGFEIGFHAGYQTLGDPERLAEEKARLDVVLGETRYGGRQHYLRFRVPDTWRHWEQVGLAYDSTMGYADHEGFRCSTCHPFRPFDMEQNRELELWEWPLIVMDRTLFQYRKLSPAQAETRIFELARRCQRVEGTFTMLWHNSSLNGLWEPWSEMYRRVLADLAEK
jgi:hypothetical protein